MKDLQFGKKMTSESYFNGILKSTKIEYSMPTLITDKSQVLTELMDCLDLIESRQTNHVTIVVQADPKTGKIKLITKNYVIEMK
jgi:hypothetical protein